MTLEEAFKKADEAAENGYCMPYPQACITLAAEVRRLKKRKKNSTKLDVKEKSNA